jgi:hypothetical protein
MGAPSLAVEVCGSPERLSRGAQIIVRAAVGLLEDERTGVDVFHGVDIHNWEFGGLPLG